jgi:hypothetical protein
MTSSLIGAGLHTSRVVPSSYRAGGLYRGTYDYNREAHKESNLSRGMPFVETNLTHRNADLNLKACYENKTEIYKNRSKSLRKPEDEL